MIQIKPHFLLFLCLFAINTNAALVSRHNGQAVYDTDLDIKFLTDPRASAGSFFDNGSKPDDGVMTWDNTSTWVSNRNLIKS